MIKTFQCIAIGIITLLVIPLSAQHPNIIMVMTDDLGWGDVGFNGNEVIKTPNLDHLASQGVIFERFYAAAPVCSPTRASVLTGRNPFRMGITHANTGHLPKEEVTLPELLQMAGYRTGFFGKWHLGTLTTKEKDSNRGGRPEHAAHYSIPAMHGYDVFFCTEAKVPTYDPMLIPIVFGGGESRRYGWTARAAEEPAEAYGTAYWDGREKPVSENLEGANSRVIMDRVIPFVEDAQEEGTPFFSTVWFHTPHLPVVADSFYRSLYEDYSLPEQLYYGSITAMDDQIGRLWQRLEELGLADNTMLWFCSDNGPERDTPGSAGIFRERKRSLYEGGVRVPAFVVWKAELPAAERLYTPCGTVDYLPTISEILNLADTPEIQLDGISIWPHLMEGLATRGKPVGFLFQESMSWIDNRYKFISTDGGATWELYDLLNDPKESEDIFEQEKAIGSAMKARLLRWKEGVYYDRK